MKNKTRFKDNEVGAAQQNSYMSSNLGASMDGDFNTPSSVSGTTSFNLVELKRIGDEFTLSRWVYTEGSKLPDSMPEMGDENAFYSGQYKSNDLGFLEISGINLLCKNGTKQVYYDEIRFGGNFADVVPQATNAVNKVIKQDEIRIFTNESLIVADLSQLKGSSVITVYSLLGSVIKTVKSSGNEWVVIDPGKHGVYLVQVINGTRNYTEKLVVF